MSDPLTATNRCTRCGEWWAQAHVCPTAKQAYAYRGPLPDCRTCKKASERMNGGFGCLVVGQCTNADRYEPLPVVKLWRVAP